MNTEKCKNHDDTVIYHNPRITKITPKNKEKKKTVSKSESLKSIIKRIRKKVETSRYRLPISSDRAKNEMLQKGVLMGIDLVIEQLDKISGKKNLKVNME